MMYLMQIISFVILEKTAPAAILSLGGYTAAAIVMTALGAANRGPRFWGDTADELDVTRSDAARHVSFGSGVHHCLGAALARMEGEIAVTRLVRRFGELSLAAEPTFNGRIILRGRDRIPITLGPSS